MGYHPGWLSDESESEDSSPPSPTSKRPEEEPKSTASSKRFLWSEDDELAVLKGLVDYRIKTGLEPNSDWDGFYSFVKGSIAAKVSRIQVQCKISKLKGKFLVNLKKINGGSDLVFTRSRDAEAFGFSKVIWGPTDAETADNGETLKEDEEVAANGEPLNENDAAKTDSNGNEEVMANADQPLNDNKEVKHDSNGKSPHEHIADKIMSSGPAVKETHDDVAELCGLRDAFDVMTSQAGLSEYQKKLQLEKLTKVASGKRKELSDEWIALCNEEVKFVAKKLKFGAKLAEAASEN